VLAETIGHASLLHVVLRIEFSLNTRQRNMASMNLEFLNGSNEYNVERWDSEVPQRRNVISSPLSFERRGLHNDSVSPF
jgi:hypothetical protein